MHSEARKPRRWGWIHVALVASIVLNVAVGLGYARMRARLGQPVPVQTLVAQLQLNPSQTENLVALRTRVRNEMDRTVGGGDDDRQRMASVLATVAADDSAALNREFGALAQKRLALQLHIVGETLRFRDQLDGAQRERFNHALAERGFVAQLAGLSLAESGPR